ncbi:Aste57867_23961 [Aphanomyces stellatus]|uniref:Aste57867_23961 protein n=1 Tax=Aphanomyces stellatus TaxID=120398 RepID=A0A485LPW1_9STRA|nr:hypothetical protein As57867_023888 [Aphanomyces stellatus]VFU00604.1 Aste57867_23961 [Aphanomyces stellatus]
MMWSLVKHVRSRSCNNLMAFTMAARDASNLAHVVVRGAGDGHKKTVVIMHGILGNKGNWGTFSRRIVNTYPDWQVIGIDHRAHGDSPSFAPPHHLNACAQDVIRLLDSLQVTPDIVCGHSFGGKVSLTYLEACRRQGRAVPKDTWVLDALPGCEQGDYAARAQDNSFNSTDVVLPKLMEVPLPITSKKELVALLEAKGFDTGQAQWMTTNLKLVSSPGDAREEYVWKMDLAVVHKLFRAFLTTDCWPTLEHPPPGARIHFVRAEYNKFWTPAILAQFAALSGDAVTLHLLEKSDHWVHVDNPHGLFALVERSFQA